MDDDDNLIEGELENIYLFDEKFIINNFRKLEDDYLGSIVLLGEAVQVQEEIDKLRQELRKKTSVKDGVEIGISRLEDKRDNLIKDIENTISYKDENGWNPSSWKGRTQYYNVVKNQYKNRPAGYVERIKGETRDLGEMPSKDELLKEFNESVEELNKVSNFQQINWRPNMLSVPFSLNKIKESIDAVQVLRGTNDTDKYYQRVHQSSAGMEELERRIRVTFSKDSSFCPHCFQDIGENVKNEIIESINKYIVDINNNREIQELQRLKFSWRPEMQKLPDICLPDEMIKSIEGDFSALYEICEGINSAIQEKIDNPDKGVNLDDIDPSVVVSRINQKYNEIFKMVEKYNSQGGQAKDIRRRCEDINHEITIIETYKDVQLLKEVETKILEVNRRKENIEEEINGISERLGIEEAKLRSESEAADKINDLLSIVFGPDVIVLEAGGRHGYRVVNKGKEALPS